MPDTKLEAEYTLHSVCRCASDQWDASRRPCLGPNPAAPRGDRGAVNPFSISRFHRD